MTGFASLLRVWTLAAALACALLPGPAPALADAAAALRLALERAAARDWPTAQVAAQDAGQIGADIIEWQRLRAGEGRLGEYEGFLARRPDWPGMALLRQKGEVAVARSTEPARVVAYFGSGAPASGTGAVALVGALLAQGRPAEAENVALAAWTTLVFTATDQAALLALQGPALKVAHEVRLDRILWDGTRAEEAERMLPLVAADWQALARARLALRALAPDASALVDRVPQALAGDAGLAYERFVWRMRKERYEDAQAMIEARSTSAASLGQPEAWAERRALLARRLMRAGAPQQAYRMASQHFLGSGADYADLEFLSGFIALRKLGDPERAGAHFARLKAAVSTPISLARAEYWTGRTREAEGDDAGAEAAYRAAAQYQTAFYGLLAAERLGLALDGDLLSKDRPASWKTAQFADSSVLQAGRLLLQAGDRTLAKRFFLHLAEAQGAGGLDQLADLALQLDEPHIALLIAKAAAERGVILARAYFPVTDLVPPDLPVSRALALAIARRESEFDPAAQSPAGARGLMQVMPATAEKVAQGLGLDYAPGKLTRDPGYNVRIGTQYLRRLADQFGPSIALIAAGYNAGPGRPLRWITEFGDPRASDVDVVDWVETIPFTETRTYVMRVVEGVVIYRARLKGEAGPVRVTAELKG